MEDRMKFLVKWASVITVLLFLLFNFGVTRVFNFIGILDSLSYAVSCTSIIILIFEKWGWKFFFKIHKVPLIFGSYTGEINYTHQQNEDRNKIVDVKIEQSYLSTKVYLSTDEISSSSLTSDIVNENGEMVLYYTYITNPKNKYSKDNPINRGTARLVINGNTIEGVYWTSRNTTGDIIIKRD